MTLQDKIREKFKEKIEKTPALIFMVNESEKWLLTQDLINMAAKATNYKYFDKIFEEFKTKEICQSAFLANPLNIKYMSLLEVKEHLPQQILYKALLNANKEATDFIKPYFFINELSKEEQIELIKKNIEMVSEIKNIEILKEYMDSVCATLEYFPAHPDPNDHDHYPDMIYSPREKFQRKLIAYADEKFKDELSAYAKGGTEEVEEYKSKKEELLLTDKGELTIDSYLTHIVNGSTIKIIEGFNTNELSILGISPFKNGYFDFDTETPTHMLHLKYKDKEYTTYLRQENESYNVLITIPHESDKSLMINTTLKKLNVNIYDIAEELQKTAKREKLSNIEIIYGMKNIGMGRGNYVRDFSKIDSLIFDYNGNINKVNANGEAYITPASTTRHLQKNERTEPYERIDQITKISVLKQFDEAIAKIENLIKEKTKER